MGLLYILGWLIFGAMLGAFLLAKMKIPPFELNGYDKGDPNYLFWWSVICSAVMWPLVLVFMVVIWPALWVYRKTTKPDK